MATSARVRVYTDGRCDFCWWARGFVEPYDTHQRIDFRDFNVPEIAAETPYSRDELAREMHVLTPGGSWHAGYFAWVAILRELPRRRWVAGVLAVPPFRWIGPVLYRWVAANRYRIPKSWFRGVGVPPPCDTSCGLPDEAIQRK